MKSDKLYQELLSLHRKLKTKEMTLEGVKRYRHLQWGGLLSRDQIVDFFLDEQKLTPDQIRYLIPNIGDVTRLRIADELSGATSSPIDPFA